MAWIVAGECGEIVAFASTFDGGWSTRRRQRAALDS
jgi:hypothetical protein